MSRATNAGEIWDKTAQIANDLWILCGVKGKLSLRLNQVLMRLCGDFCLPNIVRRGCRYIKVQRTLAELFSYDGLGNFVGKSKFKYDKQGNKIEVINYDGSDEPVRVKEYKYEFYQ